MNVGPMNLFNRIGVGLRAWYLAWFVEGGAEAVARGLPAPGEIATAGGLPAPDRRALPSPAATSPAATRPVAAPKTEPVKPAPSPKPAAPPRPTRSAALTLLEALQRESRLIDFLKEDLSAYDDAQIGAAARDVHRDAAKVLERLFALRPVLDQTEGDAVTLTANTVGRVRLVGNVREGAKSGTLAHHGWTATKTELPAWSGPRDAETIIAPAEVEIA